ncbi:hypothetical protein LIA77_03226 [Sarocladium implicatum]|nr:hypothetical protein LIA77_03226 [Sarocladium implicatum]
MTGTAATQHTPKSILPETQHSMYEYRQSTRAKYEQSPGARWARLSLRILSFVFSIANVGFAATHDFTAIMPLGPGVRASLAEHESYMGIHPAACIIVDGMTVLGLIIGSAILASEASKPSDTLSFFDDEKDAERFKMHSRRLPYSVPKDANLHLAHRCFHLVTIGLAIWEVKRLTRRAKRGHLLSSGPTDGRLFGENYQQGYEEAPPAYHGASKMTTLHPMEDAMISTAQETYGMSSSQANNTATTSASSSAA